jgi:microcystin-dependent protein
MFANRRKRVETNKTTYYDNLVHSHLSPQQGIIPEFQEEVLWKSDKTTNLPTPNNNYNIYNTNEGGVVIGKNTPPLVALDVSGGANVSTKYTINYVSIAPPIGSIMAYTVANSPEGWLICNGNEVSRQTYAGLFATIGTTFGSGDGLNTFQLPNYQGAFLRGTGTNGVYSGPSLNTPQVHATQAHAHDASTNIIDIGHLHQQSHTHDVRVNDNGHTHTLTTFNDDYNMTGGDAAPSFGANDGGSLNTLVNSNTTGITVDISLNNTPVNASFTGVTATTIVANSTMNAHPTETRPYNYGVYWIIKY